jgi:hypothetical protein
VTASRAARISIYLFRPCYNLKGDPYRSKRDQVCLHTHILLRSSPACPTHGARALPPTILPTHNPALHVPIHQRLHTLCRATPRVRHLVLAVVGVDGRTLRTARAPRQMCGGDSLCLLCAWDSTWRVRSIVGRPQYCQVYPYPPSCSGGLPVPRRPKVCRA